MPAVASQDSELVFANEVCLLARCSRKTLGRLIEAFGFPKYGRLGGRRVWRRSEVTAYLNQLLPDKPSEPLKSEPGMVKSFVAVDMQVVELEPPREVEREPSLAVPV